MLKLTTVTIAHRYLFHGRSARFVKEPFRSFSRFNRNRKTEEVKPTSQVEEDKAVAPPPVKEEWTAVKDEASGLIYYWNEKTNETTHLGAPNPNHSAVAPPPQQKGGMLSGLGGVVAEGMAFGVGSSIAHNVIGSIFGGSSSDSHHPADDDGADDEYDI